MQKAKKYDWKDSNMALFGTDTDRNVKKESAQTEPAWKGAGEKVGIQIWRIVKFKVTHWEEEEYGSFYNGDSYIILNTYVKPGEDDLEYDLHFWIGEHSTQDEYGTAAYKTVELDTLLDDKPVQHREVQGHESALFKSYFKSMTIMKGGADTGFRRVLPTEYPTRLFHIHGEKKKINVTEVQLSRQMLKSDDVFILDDGLKIYLWMGKDCNKDEKFKAIAYIQELKSNRGKAQSESLDEDDTPSNHPFFALLPDEIIEQDEEEEDDSVPCMKQLSDASGRMEFNDLDGVSKSNLNSDDVFIIDTTKHVFVFVGKGASIDERKNSMTYAHKYLMSSKHPCIPVSVIAEGKETKEFNSAF